MLVIIGQLGDTIYSITNSFVQKTLSSLTMKKATIILQIILGLTLVSCENQINNNSDIVTIDFESQQLTDQSDNFTDTVKKLKVAVSAMISPKETFGYYKELFEYISHKINYQIDLKQRKTYQEVNDMLGNNEVDLAFVCSGAYIAEKKISNIEILAVPICNNKPFYQAYIITNKSSDIKRFEDLEGKTFAFTDPLSNTGKSYADKRLRDLRTTADSFFHSTIYSYGHDISIYLVSKNIVDGATIDGLIYEYMTKFDPEPIQNLRIIEKSEEFGIPPIVIPSNLDENLKNKLKSIFLNIDKDSVGKEIINKLLIDKFVEGKDSNYNTIREMVDKNGG